MSEANRDVLSVSEAAAYLHLKPSYIYQLVSKRQLPYCKPFRGRLVFLRQDLEAIVRKARRAPEQEEAQRVLLARSSRRKRGVA